MSPNVFSSLPFSAHCYTLHRAGSSTFISEPYYREYFAGDGSQGYAQSRTIYGDAAEPLPPQSAYEGRFVTHAKSTPGYTKTVTAAGLTVDLPSPDSGIGADAITPRVQTTIQQVTKLLKLLLTLLSLKIKPTLRHSTTSPPPPPL